MSSKCLVIVNPISGRGFGRRNAPVIEKELHRRGFDVELVWTTASGTARQTAARATRDDTAVILSVGGDGTLNEVVNGVADRGIPVALFPTGTGNVLAKEYGILCSVEQVCEMVGRGKTEMLDVGVISCGGGADRNVCPTGMGSVEVVDNGTLTLPPPLKGECMDGAVRRRFLLFAGAGFDAAVARRMHLGRSGRISMASYVLPTLRMFVTYGFPRMRVTVDGRDVGTATGVLVANVHSYGGPFGFVREATPTDGWLDVCLMRGRGRLALIRYLWAGMWHRALRFKDTPVVRGRSVELVSEGEAPVQADGDFIGSLPVRIELLPGRLPMIVP